VTDSVRRHPIRALALLLLAFAALSLGPIASGASARTFVYSISNAVPRNTLTKWVQRSNGTLKKVQTIRTGGSGGLAPQPGCEPPGGCPMLDTQGEVITKGRLIFVVNPGSDTITSFREKRNGRLKRVDVQPSMGDFPNSLTVHGRVLYALNSHSDSIAGFRFARSGEMRRIVNSVRSLAAPQSAQGLSPRQIGFDRTGNVLVVTRLTPLPGGIDTFLLNSKDRPGQAIANAPTSALPFGFAFDRYNNLIMSQPAAPPELAMAGNTASYDLNTETGLLTPIETVTSDGVAPCWVVITRDGRLAFVVNTGGGAPPATVARYTLTPTGDLTFLGVTGENNANGDQFVRTDEALSRSGRYLFVLEPAIMSDTSEIDIYRVGSDGSLTLVGQTPANLPAGMSGLATRG
jgi:6-phosphogluconolactonase (cycloisomerase 2 family)